MNHVRHKWLLLILAGVLAACGSSDPPAPQTLVTQAVDVDYELEPSFAAYPRGDINRDGRVSTADLRILSEVLANGDISGLNDYRRYQADFTCDGILDTDDLAEIQNRAANDKAPAELQICPNIEVLTSNDVVVLVSNVGDLEFNGLNLTSSPGVNLDIIPVVYATATP
ncbi:MAG: hypothetical protein AAF708_02840, partial [Deinococcota bacterium]